MVSRRFDQIAEEACSEATSIGGHRRRTRTDSKQKGGVKTQVWCVNAKAIDEQKNGSSADDDSTPIQAVGSSESS